MWFLLSKNQKREKYLKQLYKESDGTFWEKVFIRFKSFSVCVKNQIKSERKMKVCEATFEKIILKAFSPEESKFISKAPAFKVKITVKIEIHHAIL